MIRRTITLSSLAAVGLSISGPAALAADLTPPVPRQAYGEAADGRDGVYVALRGGYNSLDDSVYNFNNVTAPVAFTTKATTSYRSGYAYSGALGYDFGEFTPGFGSRIEVEVGQFSNKVRGQTLSTSLGTATSFSGNQVSGTTNATTGLVNYYVDALLGPFKPFATLGLGVTSVNFSNHLAAGNSLINSTRVSWAWSGGGGIGYDITDNITLEAAYRYLELRDVQVTSAAGTNSKINLRNQQATLGVRVRF